MKRRKITMIKSILKEWWFTIAASTFSIIALVYVATTITSCKATASAMGGDGIDTIPPVANPLYVDIGPYKRQDGDMKLYFGIENVVDYFIEDDICYCLYDDPDAFYDGIVIEMAVPTFNTLINIISRANKYLPYSKEWCDIEEECNFILLYRETYDAYILIEDSNS